ncbi:MULTISPECIES: flagellar hook-associated protein FlgK [unclassified Paenibacillus]|uniref:flagellar hook-associated protein FlgK n=1 Tax=unclassified Paenibacillus TaxID=185978 RepID=UPI000CFD65DA|nr:MULTISPECIES: flagellar hook-associated protein FlgK [unclassified Paenibacillus]PRA03382.1 flagellar hook-associated protein FlgK [Paenibacillus sp. MYb63]PRA46800.1 flagellar hook-associated protein FlgK [Paenibacillus sp. MYb67]
MTSTFHSIETAKRSLFTQTTALSTTGHNVANANTEGYSRQKVNMQASIPMEPFAFLHSTTPGQLGTGVEFDSITRVREKFLDDQYRNENTNFGSWSIQRDTLEKLEAIVNEPSDTGFRTVMDNFYKSWSDLSKNPEDVTARRIVKETTLALTDAMNQISRQLDALSQDLDSNIAVKSNEIQGYLGNIANLNSAIVKIESLGDNANDLRDQRDLMTDKLSKIMNVTVTDSPQGYAIQMNGQALVTGGAVQVAVDPAFLNTAYTAGTLTNGEVHGMIKSRDTLVSDYKKQMDELANTLANGDIEITLPAGSVIPATNALGLAGGALATDTKVTVKGLNGLHQLGYTMDGTTTPGLPFFTAAGGGTAITAGNISLNAEILADPNKIATSLRTTDASGTETVIKGNNTLAILLANLKDTPMKSADGMRNAAIGAQFSAIVGQLGVQSQEAARQTSNSEFLVEQVETRRQSVSGVSLDEEMSNMIKFQHAYNASARFMTTYDELLDKLINSTGTVGR